MANGSKDDGPAYADRLREKYAKHNRMTQRALDDARRPVSDKPPGSDPYREEMDSVTEAEATVGKDGVKAKVKGAPPWLILSLAALTLAGFVAWLFFRR